ncbi:hypothetical protein ABT010_38730 [Streptomyces sp. NPDC002668]|uniref:hypothetical protein n=1 Tax=Streptomyces sp. NPDC002668 TaxID=3154422 RepID=UPI003316C1EF
MAEERPPEVIYDRHATTSTVILDIRLDRYRVCRVPRLGPAHPERLAELSHAVPRRADPAVTA